MTSEEIFKTMQDLIAEQFAVNADDVTMNSSFEDDLSADSVDLVELVMAMEEDRRDPRGGSADAQDRWRLRALPDGQAQLK